LTPATYLTRDDARMTGSIGPGLFITALPVPGHDGPRKDKDSGAAEKKAVFFTSFQRGGAIFRPFCSLRGVFR
jgi:hypothetical protein